MLDTQIKFINVPGLNNSDDWHWQTLWEEQNPSNFVRVAQEDWNNPDKNKWVVELKNTIENIYYLKYKNKRADFVDELFNYLNWDNAAQRLDFALKITK